MSKLQFALEVKSVEIHHKALLGENVGLNIKNVAVKDLKHGLPPTPRRQPTSPSKLLGCWERARVWGRLIKKNKKTYLFIYL